MLSLNSPVRTPYHDIRPGLKLAALCGFTIAVFITDSPAWLTGALLLVLALYLVPGTRFLAVGLRRLLPLWPFIAILAVWHAATDAYLEGISIGLRLVAAVALANLVTMTTRLDDLAGLASRLAAPLPWAGPAARSIGIAVALVVRFTPVLAQKGSTLLESWRGRSARPPGWRIVIPLAVLALDDAEHVAEALRARGGVHPARKEG